MNKLGTVIRFSLFSKIKKKSFRITMLVIAIILTLLINVPYAIQQFTGGGQDSHASIGLLYANQPELAHQIQQTSEQLSSASGGGSGLPGGGTNAGSKGNVGYSFVDYKAKVSEAGLIDDMKQHKIDGYLKFGVAPQGSFPSITYISESGKKLGNSAQATLETALHMAKLKMIAGTSLSDGKLAELAAPVQLQQQQVGKEGAKDHSAGSNLANYIYIYLLIILFLMINTMTGNMIASEITSEKNSRIMEILITSVSPLTQMFGKIIAMFLLGLTQILFFAVVVAGNLSMPHNQVAIRNLGIDLSQISVDVFLYGLLFYVLGYFLFATIFAAIGSLVSRTEELGQAIMPISLVLMVSFYLGMFSIPAPNTLLIKIASFIPFTAPISMLVRIGVGEVETWEILVSAALLLVAIFVFGWLSAKIYRVGVLMYGKRPSMKELSKVMREYKL